MRRDISPLHHNGTVRPSQGNHPMRSLPAVSTLRRSTVALAALLLTLGLGSPARADDPSAAPAAPPAAPTSAATPTASAQPAAPTVAAINPAALPSTRLAPVPSASIVPALATLGGIGLLSLSDHYVWQHVTNAGGSGAQRLADFVRPIGTPTVVAPPLIAGFVGGLVFHRPDIEHASVRMAASIVFASTATELLKQVVGRSRPYQVLNGDPDEVRFLSGNTSFPSGHTTLAFAAAAAIDRETSARWVPWVVYPVAGLVGWSRIHDQMHWTSDVAAGAAVGYFATNAAESFLRSDGMQRRFAPLIGVGGHGAPTVGVRFQF